MQRGGRGSGLPVDPERVREARLAAGLSLGDVAGDDVSRTFIHFVERGRSRPSRRVLELIAERTGRPLSYFLTPERAGGAETPTENISAELSAIALRIRRFVKSRRLSKVDREAMTLIEVAVRQAAVVASAIQGKGGSRR
jgi:transcriptional regulator with XRE-family HTH domain